jgi:hypothetical protein
MMVTPSPVYPWQGPAPFPQKGTGGFPPAAPVPPFPPTRERGEFEVPGSPPGERGGD